MRRLRSYEYGLLIFILAFGLRACSTIKKNMGTHQEASSQSQMINSSLASQHSQNQNTNSQTDSSTEALANLNFKSGDSPIVQVNNGQSTLNPNDWQTNHVIYANLDSLNRTSNPNTAYLEKRNATNDSLRVRQYVDPTGWHSNHGGTQIYNRGHLIAYSISKGISQNGNYEPNLQSGDQNNLKNLFTQTVYANQSIQTIYEKEVRDALYQNKKVIYQAQAIFRGNEKMARGVHLQAISTDGSLNFNVYIYNVQPGYQFNYATGQAIKDDSFKATDPPNKVTFNN